MRGKINLLMALMIAGTACVHADGIHDIINALRNVPAYSGEVDYNILMSLQPDVDYKIHLESQKTNADTLAPCDYLIDWTMKTPSGDVTGFSAYYSGNVYDFHGDRLLEYHYDWDSIPFLPSSTRLALPGIQQRMQFCNLLPQFIAVQLEEIISDSTQYSYSLYPDTIVGGSRVSAIKGTMNIKGEVCKEFIYAFDHDNFMPLYSEIENNPGALVEQTIIAKYSNRTTTEKPDPLSEENLISRYPLIFEKFRESNYAVENLPGQRLPGFSLPTTTGERYSRRAGDRFNNITVVALIDPASGFAGPTVDALRNAADNLPFNSDIIWAFTGNNVDEIEGIIPELRVGEHLLKSAKSLARDCGASSYPVIIITRKDGTVADVIIGFNKSLSSDVIQKMALATDNNE